MDPSDLSYGNRTGRPPGRIVRTASLMLPGVASVWSRVEPYADAWHEHNLATLALPGRRWIVLGDSLSQGIGASSWGAGWVGQLQRRLAAHGHDLRVVNLSATGARTDDVLRQQLPILTRLGTRHDDIVTVLVGSNDLFGGRARRALLPSSFATLVEQVPRGSIIATLPQPGAVADRANHHIERAAAEQRIVMLDLRVTGPSSWRGRLAADYFHPNDAGYAAIAASVEPTMSRVLA